MIPVSKNRKESSMARILRPVAVLLLSFSIAATSFGVVDKKPAHAAPAKAAASKAATAAPEKVGDRKKHFAFDSTACEIPSFSHLFACSPAILG
jgi:hypothetical protein